MKLRLKVNLKISDNEIVPRGTVFTDDDGPIPDIILAEKDDLRFIEILDVEPAKEVKKVAEPKAPVEPKVVKGNKLQRKAH